MLTSLALIFLVGLAMAALCQQLHLPRIIGMLVTGILLGPCVLNALDASILSISSELRQMALIIILIKAGLSLNLADLKKVGRPAVMMSCVPASCEILAFILFAPAILGITRIEAAVMGAVLGAVSPAVVIPRMMQLMDEHYGTEKSIPQLIMAGASCDDIFVIVLFSTFTSMAQGGSANIMDFVNIPVSILLGIALGAAVGFVLSWFFETAYARAHTVQQHEGHHRAGHGVPAHVHRELAQGHRLGVRPAGGGQHGLRAQNAVCAQRIQETFGEIQQAVAGG